MHGNDPTLLGVIISHSHQDHWGLAPGIFGGVPIYMGAATSRILTEAAFWTKGWSVEPAGYLVNRGPFVLGPFRITPYLNDHSGSMLLVVRRGRRPVASSTPAISGAMVARLGYSNNWFGIRPPGSTSAHEGTNIRPHDSPSKGQETQTETELERDMAGTMKATEGMVLAVFSAQNIDRLVTGTGQRSVDVPPSGVEAGVHHFEVATG